MNSTTSRGHSGSAESRWRSGGSDSLGCSVELDGTSGGIVELGGTSGDEGELGGTSGDEGELGGTSGDEGELGGTSGDEGEPTVKAKSKKLLSDERGPSHLS